MQHKSGCHPAECLDAVKYVNDDYEYALEEGEDIVFENGQPFGYDQNKHTVRLTLRDDFDSSAFPEESGVYIDNSNINAPPQPDM